MTCLALYDLDRTVLSRATFTPFLVFAARRHAPWRLALLPVWIGAMAAYKAGAMERGSLKQFGLRLFMGDRVDERKLAELGEAFADRVVPSGVAPGAARAIHADRAQGCRLVLVTAAMHFYADPIARRLGFDDVIATRHARLEEPGPCLLGGDNCYGEAKPRRVEALLAELAIDRADCCVKFYSDSTSDAPLLEWSDEGVLVDAGPRGRRLALERGWQVTAFRS